MRWSPGDRGNIEDERGRTGGGVGMAGMGIGGFLVLLVLSWLTGTNLFSLLGTDSQTPSQTVGTSGELRTTPAEEKMVDFVDAVTNDAQDTWAKILGSRYERTKVVLFRDQIQSACGFAQAATGPFYCPGDHKVYLDLGFFDELDKLGASGDFAQAYVITHELGHHVQNLLGLMDRASGARSGPHSASVAIELQADCFAGVWGHAAAASHGGQIRAGHVELEPGDADEALRAAASIGDDRLQKMSTGRVMPERFTHGSSAQRVAAFRLGMESGDPRACESTQQTR
jgi:predicted metalloprotease